MPSGLNSVSMAVRVMEKALYSSYTPFLNIEWRSGAFAGSTPEQAYFVRCDRSTMTQVDIDIGRLVCEIGVAAMKPEEFVIFRIAQKTGDSE